MEDYLCLYAHGELFVRNESMVERMIGSPSSYLFVMRAW